MRHSTHFVLLLLAGVGGAIVIIDRLMALTILLWAAVGKSAFLLWTALTLVAFTLSAIRLGLGKK